MSLNPVDPQQAMQVAESQDMVRRKLEIDALRKNLVGEKGQQAKLREACEGFESIFIQKMWEQMRKNVPQGGYLHSKEEGMYQTMYDQEFSRKMAQAGGIGLADMLYEQLTQRQGESARTSSPSVNPRLPIIPAGTSPTTAMRFSQEARVPGLIRPGEAEGALSEKDRKFEISGATPMSARSGNSFGPSKEAAMAAESAMVGPQLPVIETMNFEQYSQTLLKAEKSGRENRPPAAAKIAPLGGPEEALLGEALDRAAREAGSPEEKPLHSKAAGTVEGESDAGMRSAYNERRRVFSPLREHPSTVLPGRSPSAPSLAQPVEGEALRPFGWQTAQGRREWHQGIDYAAEPGGPARAVMDGRVAFGGEREGYGRLVILEHEGGWSSFYGNAELSGVKIGDFVEAGTEFAVVTAQPEESAAHLHFELRRGELAVNPARSAKNLAAK